MKRDYTKIFNYGKNLLLKNWNFANIFVTRKCNLRCEYCNVWKRSYNDLCFEDLCNEIDILVKYGCSQISLTGGEPTMREDLPDLVHYISKKGVMVSLVSNTLLIDENLVKTLIKAGLNGFSASFDSFSGFGKYSKKVIEVSREFAKDIMVTLITVMSRKNLKEIMKINLMCNRFGFWHNPIIIQSTNGFFSSRCDELIPSSSEIKKIIQELIYLKTVGMPISSTFEYLTKVPDFCNGKRWVCQPLKYAITLNNDGKIMVCQDVQPFNLKLSDIEGDSSGLKELIQSFTCKGCLFDCFFNAQNNRNLYLIRNTVFLAYARLKQKFQKKKWSTGDFEKNNLSLCSLNYM